MFTGLMQTTLLIAIIFGGEYGLFVRPMMIIKDVLWSIPVSPENILETGVIFAVTLLLEVIVILLLQGHPEKEVGY